MPDKFTKEQRSKIMSKIRSKGSKMELRMKAALESSKIDFEYQPKIFGRPDFLVKPSIAIFCDSSFWHGRNWDRLKKQLTQQYWQDHIDRNRKRDREVNRQLKKQGYLVIRFWEEDTQKDLEKCVAKIKQAREFLLNSCKKS